MALAESDGVSAATPQAPAAAPSKAQTAYQWIKQRIFDAEYTPGHRLVLATIAGELDMSVVPVREAIRQLEAEGLVTFEHNVGARVAMRDAGAYRDSMQTLGILEGAATALAAPAMDREGLEKARALNQRLAASLEDFDPHLFTQVNHEFHQVLFQHCPNARLTALVDSEWERLGHLRDSTFAFVPGRARESVAEHETILALIEQGAPTVQIERAAREHRTNTLTSYLTSQEKTS